MSNNIIYPFGPEGSIPTQLSDTQLKLANKPVLRMTRSSLRRLIISHPLIYRGSDAEVVLMCYRRKVGKKYGSHNRHYKKGWTIFSYDGYIDLMTSEFSTFKNSELQVDIFGLVDDIDENADHSLRSEIGIAVRIPNPEWTRSSTMHKNATYKGIPESLYSPISILVWDNDGFGIKK